MSLAASQAYNSLILSYVVLCFNKLDLFSFFIVGVTFEQLLETGNFEPSRLKALLKTATSLGLLQQSRESYRLTPLGEDLANNRGFFTWAIGGYSELLEHMDLFMLAPGTDSRPYIKPEYVAIGSDECNQTLMQFIFDGVIDGLPGTHVADLGCGNAGRLIHLLGRRPELTGLGIDVSAQAIELAIRNRKRYGLERRLKLECKDAFRVISGSDGEPNAAHIVMSFMMLHDLFNIPELQNGQLFRGLQRSFPRAKYFLLADTCLSETRPPSGVPPIFTAGFELVHAMRGIQLFPLSYYREQFQKSGLKLIAQHDFGVPNTYLFVLER